MLESDRQTDAEGDAGRVRRDPEEAPSAPTTTEALLRLQATAGNAAVTGLVQRSARIQRMDRLGGFYNPADDLDGSDSDADDDARTDFVATAKAWKFDDVTTEEFRDNHVIKGSGDLVGKGEEKAIERKKPVSTSILFTADDQRKLVDRIRADALGFARGAAPDSLQRQTTEFKLLFAQFRRKSADKKDEKNYKVQEIGFGKLQYAAEGNLAYGGKQYQVNHLDGMADIERS